MRAGLLLIVLLSCLALPAQSYQSRIHYRVKLGDTEQLHQLILLDYTKLLGTALDIEGDELFFQLRSSSEVSVIPLNQLRFLGVFTGADINPLTAAGEPAGFSDLTYERTALPYKTKAQLRVINLIYSVVEWNTDEHLQVGVGLAGPLGAITTARLRYTILPDVHLGLSNQTIFPLMAQTDNRVLLLGDLHTMLTIGNETRFFNLGTGLLYTTERFNTNAWGHRMAIGGRIGQKWHLYGEALMVLGRDRDFNEPEVTIIPTVSAALGVRQHRWQFGMMGLLNDSPFANAVPLPYVGYAYYWGK